VPVTTRSDVATSAASSIGANVVACAADTSARRRSEPGTRCTTADHIRRFRLARAPRIE
jgi:hypothetical protein